MTEAEWLASEDPAAMLAEVDGHLRTYSTGHQEPVFKASDRKLRLWAVVAGPCEVCRGFGNGAEESASSYTEVSGASHAAFVCDAPCMSNPEKATLLRDIVGNPFRPWLCQRCARGPAFLHLAGDGIEFACRRCRKTPEPTRSVVLDLAQAAYDERTPGRPHKKCRCGREFAPLQKKGLSPPLAWCSHCAEDGGWYADAVARESDGTLDPLRLAVLADALEEAGCDSGAILTHLRFPGPHVRGCWAIDLILGKE